LVENAALGSVTGQLRDLRRKTHETIAKVTNDCGVRQTFNTAIAAVMELLNEVGRLKEDSPLALAVEREALESAVLLLAPMVPHICHHLWNKLGHEGAIIDAQWPVVDTSALVRDSIEMVVQVNGKVRAKIDVAANAPQSDIEAMALAEENVMRFTDGLSIRKVIVVPKKLVSIVAN